jgi:hypothetical protein
MLCARDGSAPINVLADALACHLEVSAAQSKNPDSSASVQLLAQVIPIGDPDIKRLRQDCHDVNALVFKTKNRGSSTALRLPLNDKLGELAKESQSRIEHADFDRSFVCASWARV